MIRRQFLVALGAAPYAFGAGPARSRMRTLEGSGKVWTIWSPPGRFTKNPDIVRIPDGCSPHGRLMPRYPDQYQIDRVLEVNPNPPVDDQRTDNGYSSWLTLPGGDVYLVDYSDRGDKAPAGHLYAPRFSLAEFER